MHYFIIKNLFKIKNKQSYYLKNIFCLSKHFQLIVLFILFVLNKINYCNAQCPQIELPCRCEPSIYEPIAIICENAKGLDDALKSIENAKTLLVIYN